MWWLGFASFQYCKIGRRLSVIGKVFLFFLLFSLISITQVEFKIAVERRQCSIMPWRRRSIRQFCVAVQRHHNWQRDCLCFRRKSRCLRHRHSRLAGRIFCFSLQRLLHSNICSNRASRLFSTCHAVCSAWALIHENCFRHYCPALWSWAKCNFCALSSCRSFMRILTHDSLRWSPAMAPYHYGRSTPTPKYQHHLKFK